GIGGRGIEGAVLLTRASRKRVLWLEVDEIDHAALLAVAVQGGSRAFHHLDMLYTRQGVGGAGQVRGLVGDSVRQGTRVESAQDHAVVEAEGELASLGRAADVAQAIGQLDRALFVEQLPRHDLDAARKIGQWCSGL